MSGDAEANKSRYQMMRVCALTTYRSVRVRVKAIIAASVAKSEVVLFLPYKEISSFASWEQAPTPSVFPADLRLPKIDTETHQRAFVWFSYLHSTQTINARQ